MAPRVPKETKQNVVRWHFELGLEPADIATLAGCSVRTVQYVIAWHRDFNGVHKKGISGRHRALNTGDLNYISAVLASRPKTYLDELQGLLVQYRGVEVSVATLSRTLRRLAITNKQVASEAAERNELLRAIWQGKYGHIPAEYFVWLDEASVDDTTYLRRRGWAGMGVACVSRDTFIRGQRYSVLPALTYEGIISLNIFEGSVNKNRFISFIRQDVVSLLGILIPILSFNRTPQAPLLNPYPAPRSVVVLDNCAIHHDEAIRRIIVDECGK